MRLSHELMSNLNWTDYSAFMSATRDTAVEMGLSMTIHLEGARGIRIDDAPEELVAFCCEYLSMLSIEITPDEVR
jgi:hypothetical protein